MKIKEGFKLMTVADRKIVVATDKLKDEFKGIIHLNDTSAYIWNLIKENEGIKVEEISKKLVEKYDVNLKDATKDVEEFVLNLKNANILE